MNRWLLKTDPETYSFKDLLRERKTVWDGVRNPAALRHIGQMAKGDPVMIYETGAVKSIVGLAQIDGSPQPDPSAGDAKLAVVPVKVDKQLPKPVPLASVKADPAFRDFALVRVPRLSVMPVSAEQWDRLLRLAE